ncbi:MAG: DUF4386 domain-containing protein [Ignavibacteriales bacterium]|nr:DUF4386 domain-containing protein [Ignavibacteriales bacterium]
MNPTKKTARYAGLLYLLWIITGLYGLLYVPSKIFVKGDAAATSANILANEFLFRTYIYNDFISATLWIVLLLALHRLFKEVSERQVKLMAALVMVQIPVSFMMGAFNLATLMILKGEVLKTFELSQRLDVAMLFLKINDYGTLTLELFWGLWLFPLGMLVYRSGFLPRLLGVWLIVCCIAYVILSFVTLLFPEYVDTVKTFSYPAYFAELGLMLWLLIMGAKVKAADDTGTAPQ